MATAACAQGSALERRVMAVSDGLVELHFDARAEACGDGARWYRFGDDLWSGSYSEGWSASGRSACLDGPVRVLVTIAGREIVRLETFVGPLRHDESATDLGTVPGRQARRQVKASLRLCSNR